MCMIAGTSTIRIRVASSRTAAARPKPMSRSEEHTSELQSQSNLVCRLLLEKKKKNEHFCASSSHRIRIHTMQLISLRALVVHLAAISVHISYLSCVTATAASRVCGSHLYPC